MPAYSTTIQIEARPDAVYERVADLATHGTWSADELEVVASGPDRFHSTVTKGKTIEADISVIERVPPARFVFDVADATGAWRHTFTITPSGAGSSVTREIAGELKGAQLVLYWLVLYPIKKPNARRAMERLKAVLET